MSILRRYKWRIKKWSHYATGRSLHNAPQGPGRAYQPDKLEGYFNDLTAKTKWAGACDGNGIPVVQTDRGNKFSFPITVFQKSLGHWDLWLLSARMHGSELEAFLGIARWALMTLDENGGWRCWHMINRGTSSPYSSMAQGQGISILVRAFQVTGQVHYLAAAIRAAEAMIDPGGTLQVCTYEATGICFEEYPGSRMRAVLNGWIFSLMGLYDLLLIKQHEQLQAALDSSLSALIATLPQYHCGYWSLYDLGGTIASPFYHSLHISQLQVLAQTFPNGSSALEAMATQWISAEKNPFSKARALAVKVRQKLHDTGNEEFT